MRTTTQVNEPLRHVFTQQRADKTTGYIVWDERLILFRPFGIL